MQCIGRLVNDTKGEWALPFEGTSEYFHLPIRCTVFVEESGLCPKCQQRDLKTQQKVKELRGCSIQASHPALLHGTVKEPIPFWSHVYDGTWYRLKVQEGYTIQKEDMARVKKAVEKAYKNETPVEPEPIPGGTLPKKGRKKTEVVATPSKSGQTTLLEFMKPVEVVEAPAPAPAPAATVPKAPAVPKKRISKKAPEPVPAPEPAPAPAPEPVPEPAPVPVKKIPKKRLPKVVVTQAEEAPVAYVPSTEKEPVDETITISVKKQEIDGRTYYVDFIKQKVYDMKFKYVGRYDSKENTVATGFYDSDIE